MLLIHISQCYKPIEQFWLYITIQMLKVTQAWVCIPSFHLTGSFCVAYLLSLLEPYGWSSMRTGSFTNFFILLLVKYMQLIIHTHLLSKYTSIPFVMHPNPARTSLISKTDNMIITFNGNFSCLQTFPDNLYESEARDETQLSRFC